MSYITDVMFDSDSDEENCLLVDTGIENANVFKSSWCDNIKLFLKRDSYLGVRGTTVSEEELEFLNFKYDIDGVSIVWKDIGKSLSLEYSHIAVAPTNNLDIRPIYSVAKKHFNLREYGRISLSNLRDACGFQVIYSAGWETWIAFVPKIGNEISYTREMLRNITIVNLKRFLTEFQKQIKKLLDLGVATDTLAKNNLEDLKRMFVLPGDRQIILSVFQKSLECTDLLTKDLRPILYSFRFGDKCRTPVNLPILDESGVEDICVHVGINISDFFHDIFWCRQGLNNVIGRRGKLTSSLSFFECANFQSNLDERGVDIGRKVLDICRIPDNIRFVQMYADTPHRRPRTIVHPVSAAVILANGILRENSQTKVNQEAQKYLSEILNNFNQLRESNCRMEFVMGLNSVCRNLVPSELIDEFKLCQLLKEEPMIVPFEHSGNVIGCIRQIGLHLYEQLNDIYRKSRGTADSVAVWDAFQYECAIERMLWGEPFCLTSHIYSVNLGVGLGHPTRCLTDQKGFLCLEDSSSCCVDENTMPPLSIYSKNTTVQSQIKRVFGLHNYVDSSQTVAGRRVVMCLLKDLHESGKVFLCFTDFFLMLKQSSGNENKKIVGGINIRDLAENLTRSRKVKWPMVFGTVKTLFNNDAEKMVKVCIEGVRALELGYFPAFRQSDESRSEGLNWRYTYGFWVLAEEEGRNYTYEIEAASLHTLVLMELEKMKICHTSHYEGSVFPWLKSVLEKIAEKNLNKEEKTLILAFVTCVALLMNGCYVDYLNLSRLERKLPLTQVMLRMLEVQCKFRLGNINTFTLWRLHPSIPYKLNLKKTSTVSQSTQQNQEQVDKIRDENELIGLETTNSDTENAGQIVIINSRHTPTNECIHKVVWSPEELVILKDVVFSCSGTGAQRYRLYQQKCLKRGIQDRTLKAFLRKVRRMFPRQTKH